MPGKGGKEWIMGFIKHTGPHTGNFTVLDNKYLWDKRLSLEAKGLLSRILSLPDDWRFSLEGLTRMCLEGRDAVKSALRELEKAGYAVTRTYRDSNGRFASDYEFYETGTDGCDRDPGGEGTCRKTDAVSPRR